MTVPLALVSLAALLVFATPRVLVTAAWVRRSPRLGILAWQSAVFAVLASATLLSLTAIVPVQRVSFDLAHFVHACPEILQRRYQVVEDSLLHLVSLVIAVGSLLALTRATVRCALTVRRARTRQRDLLDLLVRQGDGPRRVHVLEHAEPLAYCVPGAGRGRVVVTTAALETLDSSELQAVLAHERAHLRGRHDFVLFGADVAATAFPWARFFATARSELCLLVEMLADDRAASRVDRHSLATALVGLGQGAAPQGAVGAAGDTTRRVERLLDERRGMRMLSRATVAAVAAVVLASPWVIALAPVLAARNGTCAP